VENLDATLATAQHSRTVCTPPKQRRERDSMLMFAAAAATAVAGFAGMGWWAAVAGGCLLSLLLFREELRVVPPDGADATWELAETITNVLVGAGGALLAFVAGRLVSLFI
jgi:hypothetical protein